MSFQYLQKWTDRFLKQADVELIVQEKILPIHSLLFQESEILQACIDNTTKDEKPRLSSCFGNTKLMDMDAFLCHMYPNVDPGNKLIDSNSAGIVQIAKMLGCKSMLEAVRVHLEAKPGIVTKDLHCMQPSHYEKWLSTISDLGSQKLELAVVESIYKYVERLFQGQPDEKWMQVFSMLSGQAVYHLISKLKESDKPGKKLSAATKLSIGRECTGCKAKTVEHEVCLSNIDEKGKRFYTKKIWRCSECGGSNPMNIIALV